MKPTTLYYSSILLISLLIVSHLIDAKGRRISSELQNFQINPSQNKIKASALIPIQPRTLSKKEASYFKKIEMLISKSLLRFEYEIIDTSQATNHFKIHTEDRTEMETDIASMMIKYQLINDSPDSIFYLSHTCDFGGNSLIMDRTFFKESFIICCNASFLVRSVIAPFSKIECLVNIDKIYESSKKIKSKEINYSFTPIPPNISSDYLNKAGVLNIFLQKTRAL
jgi:hypothetical protein